MNHPAPLLEARDLGKKLPDRWLWKNLSFSIHTGSQMAITGPSGAGKTQLLRVLAALASPETGKLLFQNQELGQWKIPLYRSQVIYLPQKPAMIEGTVETNLQAAFRLAIHQHRNYDRTLVLQWLAQFKKDTDFLDRPSTALSGGEAQIVAFIRALQLNPTVLIFDEPTASLDENSEQALEQLVHEWQREDSKRAFIWTSHNATQLKRMTTQNISLGDH